MGQPNPPRSGVFINYRREDTGWAANALADALRRRLGPNQVFLDNSSILLGQQFERALEDGVQRSGVLVALIGPGWDRPPLLDRLQDPGDWVRRELILAQQDGVLTIPVLVDRQDLPTQAVLPAELGFLPRRQRASLRQSHPGDLDSLATSIAQRLPAGQDPIPASAGVGAEPTRSAVEALARRVLPPVQQWSGNRDRLIDLALAVLTPNDRLRYLAPARWDGRPAGSATVLVTTTDLLIVDVEESFLIRGETRLPRARIQRIEVAPTLPLFADLVLHTTAGDTVALRGLFRDQARRLADHLREPPLANR